MNLNQKTFRGDIEFFHQQLIDNKPFSVTRFGDGECLLMDGGSIQNKEGRYTRNSEVSVPLISALQYRSDNYYVGVPCVCCLVKPPDALRIRALSGQAPEQLTFSNVFVNSNFKYFNEHILPSLNHYPVSIICNERANTTRLPFPIQERFSISGYSACTNSLDSIQQITKSASKQSGTVYLFAAGPLSNLAIMECNKINPHNFYLNIGSTLDIQLGLGATRRYLRGGETLQKVCIWSMP